LHGTLIVHEFITFSTAFVLRIVILHYIFYGRRAGYPYARFYSAQKSGNPLDIPCLRYRQSWPRETEPTWQI